MVHSEGMREMTFEQCCSEASIKEMIAGCRMTWDEVSPEAEPYLQALEKMDNIMERSMNMAGVMVVVYFLGRSKKWTGPVARAIKKELRKRVAQCPQ